MTEIQLREIANKTAEYELRTYSITTISDLSVTLFEFGKKLLKAFAKEQDISSGLD